MGVKLDVRCSWDAALVGLFQIGRSKIGSTDKLSPAWTFGANTSFDGEFDNLSELVDQATWSRGRNDLLTKTLPGTGSATIVDEDGIYNPSNDGSPLAGKLVPGRPFSIRATDDDGNQYGCFRGFLRDEPTHDASKIPATTTFNLADLFVPLGRTKPTITSTGPTTTGAAIGLLLDEVGLTDSEMRILAVGDSILDFLADASASCLTLIGDLLEAEQGFFFINGFGQGVYLDRYDRNRRESEATFDGVADDVETGGSGIDSIINRQKVNDAVYQDQDSARTFDWGDGDEITTSYLDDLASAQTAERIVRRYSQLRPSVRTFSLPSPVGDNERQLLTREIGDRITLTPGGAGSTGTAGDFFIENLAITAGKAGTLSGTWLLSKRIAYDDAFLIGRSPIGAASPPLRI